MVVDQTRTFTITAPAKVLYLSGVGADPLPADGPPYEAAETVEASEAKALPKGLVGRLAADGMRPAPEHVLFVRMFPPGPDADLTVRLKPVFEGSEPEEHVFEHDEREPNEQGFVERRFLLLYGNGEPPAIPEAWGLEALDVTDKTPAGHAPQIQARALTRRKRNLPIRAGVRPFFLSI
jgi:hypothetical protein